MTGRLPLHTIQPWASLRHTPRRAHISFPASPRLALLAASSSELPGECWLPVPSYFLPFVFLWLCTLPIHSRLSSLVSVAFFCFPFITFLFTVCLPFVVPFSNSLTLLLPSMVRVVFRSYFHFLLFVFLSLCPLFLIHLLFFLGECCLRFVSHSLPFFFFSVCLPFFKSPSLIHWRIPLPPFCFLVFLSWWALSPCYFLCLAGLLLAFVFISLRSLHGFPLFRLLVPIFFSWASVVFRYPSYFFGVCLHFASLFIFSACCVSFSILLLSSLSRLPSRLPSPIIVCVRLFFTSLASVFTCLAVFLSSFLFSLASFHLFSSQLPCLLFRESVVFFIVFLCLPFVVVVFLVSDVIFCGQRHFHSPSYVLFLVCPSWWVIVFFLSSSAWRSILL